MATDDLEQLEGWVAPLLAKLQPGERRALARTVGTRLRRSQQARIADQRNPDGSAYAPRKRSKRLRDKAGRIKRGAMFAQLRKAKFLKIKATADQVSIGFTGRVARIARVHQEGRADRVGPDGPVVRYDRRQLLGFSAADQALIRDLLIEHLTED